MARLRSRLAPDPPHIRLGIGDDAAVLEPERGMQIVVTTDSLVEDVHFRRAWTPAAAIGHKALAVNLSDLAAMGATPRASLLSLGLPATLPIAEFDALIDGYATLSAATRTPLVGGNIARSPGPLLIDVTAIGSVRPRRVLRRTGARAGDELYVTGAPGRSAAGLALLAAGIPRDAMDADERECLVWHERPEPRLRLGRIVARTSAATAAMDLSDGLADAAATLAAEAGVGVVLDEAAVPIARGVSRVAGRIGGRSALEIAIGGGEDYELAFVVPARRRSRFLAAVRRSGDVTVTRVGVFERGHGAWLETGSGRRPLPHGFAHF
ncbi:MAG: thiamine-phosphate kinase [Acidobacteria bacterium SCN 69-37]|nr:MAG: thiamine-phosphate kinase [Acidobacteria bacterium SCN 69-37]